MTINAKVYVCAKRLDFTELADLAAGKFTHCTDEFSSIGNSVFKAPRTYPFAGR